MRRLPISAVSITALLLATAACGNKDNVYDTAETDTVETDADRTAYNDADDADAAESDAYAARRAEPYTTAANEPTATTQTTNTGATETPAYQTAAAEAPRTKAEIEALATSAFVGADKDNDGVIDREEYVQLALASARDFDTFVKEPMKLMSVNPVTDPAAIEDDMATDEAMDDPATGPAIGDVAADETMPVDPISGDAAADATLPESTTAVALDAKQTADIQTAAAESFETAAGEDGELTAEELRTAFLARFEEADEDGDDALDEAELRTFAALTRGE